MSDQKKYTVVIDDNILMKDQISTAGSKILNNFVPPFNAAVIDKIQNAGMNILQSIPNEFGVSLTGSFGSVAAVSDGSAEIGLSSDVSGIIRNRSAENGVCFIRPTYGTVSRFGLVSTAPSLEQIGVVCKKIDDGFDALSKIAGFDERDGAIAANQSYVYDSEAADVRGLRVAVFENCASEMNSACEALKKAGATVEAVDFPLLDAVSKVTYVIMSAETSNSISRYDGIKFGYRSESFTNLEDLYVNTRSECFTEETKILTLLGMYVLSKEQFDDVFDKSLKIRRLIKEKVNEIFTKFDCIAMPASIASGGQTDTYNAFYEAYQALQFSALPNLAGTPAISLPYPNGGSGGIQFTAKAFDENTLLRIGGWFQKMTEEGLR